MIFLAGRSQLQPRTLHTQIKQRFQTDADFGPVQLRPSDRREPGPYRVVADTSVRAFLGDDSYPVAKGRLEIGFQLTTQPQHEYYWINWIEPARDFLLGWHQDADHSSLGAVHIQVNDTNGPVEHRSATFIDKHPMAVVEARLKQLPHALDSVQWNNNTVTGISW